MTTKDEQIHHLQQENNELKVQLHSALDCIEKQKALIPAAAGTAFACGALAGPCACGKNATTLPQQFQQLHLSESAPPGIAVFIRELQAQIAQLQNDIQLRVHENELYREDFQRERSDREKTQNRLLDVEKKLEETQNELSITKELLDQHNGSAMRSALDRRNHAMQKIREEYNRKHPYAPARPVSYRARGSGYVVCDGEDERPLQGDEDIIDSLVEPDGSSPMCEDNQLQCSKCNRGFHVDDHVEFLDHIDSCKK